jgi:hypothetical protein
VLWCPNRSRQLIQTRQDHECFLLSRNPEGGSCYRSYQRRLWSRSTYTATHPFTPVRLFWMDHSKSSLRHELLMFHGRANTASVCLVRFLLTTDPWVCIGLQKEGTVWVFVFTSMWQGLFLSRAPLCLDIRTAAELLWPQALELQVHTLGSEKGPLESPPRSVEATSQAWKCQECEEEYLYQ